MELSQPARGRPWEDASHEVTTQPRSLSCNDAWFLPFSDQGPKSKIQKCGGVLLSHPVTRAVPSALEGLTSVFGMGTGVSPPLSPPQNPTIQLSKLFAWPGKNGTLRTESKGTNLQSIYALPSDYPQRNNDNVASSHRRRPIPHRAGFTKFGRAWGVPFKHLPTPRDPTSRDDTRNRLGLPKVLRDIFVCRRLSRQRSTSPQRRREGVCRQPQ